MTQAPEDLRTHRPAVPPPVALVIMRALEKNPADRWQSAAEMLAWLEPYPGAAWVVGAAGDSARMLVPSGDRAADPRAAYVSWSDDSRTLYYLAVAATGETSIWAVAVAGGAPRLTVRFDDASREWHRFGFVARGGRFYFTVGDRQSDVWAAEVEAGR